MFVRHKARMEDCYTRGGARFNGTPRPNIPPSKCAREKSIENATAGLATRYGQPSHLHERDPDVTCSLTSWAMGCVAE